MVKRLHTKQLRYLPDKKGRVRKSRPKSFSSEESANAWAFKKGIKTFTLRNLKNSESSTKKIIVVETKQ